jgi:hypothetical protein
MKMIAGLHSNFYKDCAAKGIVSSESYTKQILKLFYEKEVESTILVTLNCGTQFEI